VRLINGWTKPRGYKLSLSFLRKRHDFKRLSSRWRAIGQFRYFDENRWAPTIVGPPVGRQTGGYLDDRMIEPRTPRLFRHRFTGRIHGLPIHHPEAKLVRAYVSWLHADEDFMQDTLPGGLRTDLFDRSGWRLIEAKVYADRETLRSALGQLLDYKRHYPRRPSVGILVGTRPSPASLKYLGHYGITAVWQTPSGRFRDSTGSGDWTTLRRRSALSTPDQRQMGRPRAGRHVYTN